MRLACLYLRARQTEFVTIGLVLLAALSALVLHWTRNEEWMPRLLAMLPLGAASLLAGSGQTPFGETERTVSQPLPPLRFLHLGGLLALAALLSAVATLAAPALDGEWRLIRNLFGYTGIGFLTAAFLDARRAWVGPIVYGLAIVITGGDGRLAWPILDAANRWATGIALGLLVAGLGFVTLFGTQEQLGESG